MLLPEAMIVMKGTVMIVMIAMIVTTVMIAMIAMIVVLHHQDMIPILLAPDHPTKQQEEEEKKKNKSRMDSTQSHFYNPFITQIISNNKKYFH